MNRDKVTIDGNEAAAYVAFRTNEIKPGSFIVILGPGPFGLFILQVALASGPSHVVMVGLSTDHERLELAKKS